MRALTKVTKNPVSFASETKKIHGNIENFMLTRSRGENL